MDTLLINILDPKATKLLKDLEEMELISIQKPSEDGFVSVLKKLRSISDSTPTLEEITAEVESERKKRYDK
ncbi:hypothetical protein ACWKW6_27830 [Dyadobacter jiangsuensis]|jgi:hypothetical protein|uniref:hypothetical protein n=1 Tax=Dyadobacter fermentans TaxID=94254 RepID=UPI001CBAE4EA|nr:hypothetical protein [Dyadobacter fermentans]MBZ1360554.1 hypothetical protein [Dyadobacter fermentans]